MTYRELLAQEFPDCIDEDLVEGCWGCPYEYGYETRRESKDVCEYPRYCDECWNREIPEKRTAEAATPDGSET